jgi:hypothetical protein
MLEDLAKLAYEFHQRTLSAGTEIWEWVDLPPEVREHWRELIGTVLDYRLEHRKRRRKEKVSHAKN